MRNINDLKHEVIFNTQGICSQEFMAVALYVQ